MAVYLRDLGKGGWGGGGEHGQEAKDQQFNSFSITPVLTPHSGEA